MVVLELEQSLQGFANGRLIINDENGCGRCRLRVAGDPAWIDCGLCHSFASLLNGHCLSLVRFHHCHRELKMESGSLSWLALNIDLARMFLDDAVGHG